MKKLLVIFLALAGCSDGYDSLVNAAPGPQLRFSSDTLRVREKDYGNVNNNRIGMLTLYTSPAVHQLNMQFSDTSGKVHFNYRGERLSASQSFVVPQESNTLYCSVDTPGRYAVDFYLTDQLERTVTKKLLIQCLAGVKPIAAMQYDMISTTENNWRYVFDASGSRQPYGTIMDYRYRINGVPIVTNNPLLQWYFHSAGRQQLSFYVTDDLGISSDTLQYSIQIQ